MDSNVQVLPERNRARSAHPLYFDSGSPTPCRMRKQSNSSNRMERTLLPTHFLGWVCTV
jgi:hypothetical protein